MKHSDITRHFSNFIESFSNVENEEFDLDSIEISEAIFRHIFKIKSSLWKHGVDFNRRKRMPISEIFQDLVAFYIKLGLNSEDYEVVLEESMGRLQPDILIKFKGKNLFIVEVKTNLGWKRDMIESDMGTRIKALSRTFGVPFQNIIYIFQNPWNMPKSFTQKYWDQDFQKAQVLPTEFPYDRIRPLLTAEDPFYTKKAKSIDRRNDFHDLTSTIEEKVKTGIVIPLEITIKQIIEAGKKTEKDFSKYSTKKLNTLLNYIRTQNEQGYSQDFGDLIEAELNSRKN
jgi:hypothetical protein